MCCSYTSSEKLSSYTHLLIRKPLKRQDESFLPILPWWKKPTMQDGSTMLLQTATADGRVCIAGNIVETLVAAAISVSTVRAGANA